MLVVAGSFAFCCAVYGCFFLSNRNVAVSSELASLTHHFIAALIAFYATYVSREHIWTEASMGANALYPMVTELQHFNIGYFLYDCLHVFTWDTKFIPHHLIALFGFWTSEYSGVFALANAVNIFIAEIGSMMYNWYNKNKTLQNYIFFVTGYTISRVIFFIWSISVIYQCYFYTGKNKHVWWIPYVGSALQVSLLYVNATFLMTHVKKLRTLLNKTKSI